MSELETKLRETARQLLADEQVDVIIGYASGTLPLRTAPCFVDDPAQVDQLFRTNVLNLAEVNPLDDRA